MYIGHLFVNKAFILIYFINVENLYNDTSKN